MVFGVLLVEDEGDGHTEIRPEGVNEHGPTHICGMVDVQVDSLVGGVEYELKECDDDELERTRPSQDCTHCDEGCRTCEV